MIYRSLSWWTLFSRITKTTMNRNKYNNYMRDINTAGREVTATYLANLVEYNLIGLREEMGGHRSNNSIQVPAAPLRGRQETSGFHQERDSNRQEFGNNWQRGEDNYRQDMMSGYRSQNVMGNESFRGNIGRMNEDMQRGYSFNSANTNPERDDLRNSGRPYNSGPTLPMGVPGGPDDPRRQGLSGSGRRWYLRYLNQGLDPEEARIKAEQHSAKYHTENYIEQTNQSERRPNSRSAFERPVSQPRKREDPRKAGDPKRGGNPRRGGDPRKGGRRKRTPSPAPLGQPGGLDDPRRKGLSGACTRWYLKYLQRGLKPDLARKKAEEHSVKYKQYMSRNKSAAEKTKPELSRNINETVTALSTESSRRVRRRGPIPPPPGEPGGKDDPRRRGLSGACKRRYLINLRKGLDPDEAIRKAKASGKLSNGFGASFVRPSKMFLVCVAPKDFPTNVLSEQDLSSLKEAIMSKTAADKTLQSLNFHAIGGMLVIDCGTIESVERVKPKIIDLENWDALKFCTESEILNVQMYCLILPRSAAQPPEMSLALLEAQNENINAKKWTILKSEIEGTSQCLTVCIDYETFNVIRKYENKLHYRFGIIIARRLDRKLGYQFRLQDQKEECESGEEEVKDEIDNECQTEDESAEVEEADVEESILQEENQCNEDVLENDKPIECNEDGESCERNAEAGQNEGSQEDEDELAEQDDGNVEDEHMAEEDGMEAEQQVESYHSENENSEDQENNDNATEEIKPHQVVTPEILESNLRASELVSEQTPQKDNVSYQVSTRKSARRVVKKTTF